MKKIFITTAIAISLSACVYSPYINQIDLQDTDFGALAYQKYNKACYSGFFFIPFETDLSIAKAAFEAGIHKVSYVESEVDIGLWPLIWKECIVVYGK